MDFAARLLRLAQQASKGARSGAPARNRFHGGLRGARLCSRGQLPLRAVLVAAGNGWTAYFDNELGGGDPFPWVGRLSSELSCHGVLATHVPRTQYPFPATQFELLGPEGEPPLEYVRTVSAGVFDSGGWSFEARGAVQPFEQIASYGARHVRDRFTRAMLVQYLQARGIHADDPDFNGTGHLFQEHAAYERRTMSVEQARSE